MNAEEIRALQAPLKEQYRQQADAALVTLRALAASPHVPPGAKFETFAHLDQLLGLDLASQVGR